MVARTSIRSMLIAGRLAISIGRTEEVAALVCAQPKRASQLIECLWDDDLGVAGRAADALEKVTRHLPSLLLPWKGALLGLMSEAQQNKLRWSLAVMIPRIPLGREECAHAAEILQTYLEDPSSIVKTCALQGLVDLTSHDSSLQPLVVDLLRIHSRSGTPACGRGDGSCSSAWSQSKTRNLKKSSAFALHGRDNAGTGNARIGKN